MTVLKAERRARGWSQTTLAFHGGSTQGDVSKFERGKAIPSPACAARLARALGVPVESLLREVREPEVANV